jgi:hypothetical protein
MYRRQAGGVFRVLSLSLERRLSHWAPPENVLGDWMCARRPGGGVDGGH